MLIFGILLLSLFLVSANGDHGAITEEGKKLVESNADCDDLSDEQLETIGEYFMEQMHPGEAHELMDKMMGGEGSESLRQMHIAMAKRIYCDDTSGMANYGMMGMMMGGGMMNMAGSNMMGYGMMGNGSYGFMGGWMLFWWLLGVGLVSFVFSMVFWQCYKWLVEEKKSGRRK